MVPISASVEMKGAARRLLSCWKKGLLACQGKQPSRLSRISGRQAGSPSALTGGTPVFRGLGSKPRRLLLFASEPEDQKKVLRDLTRVLPKRSPVFVTPPKVVIPIRSPSGGVLARPYSPAPVEMTAGSDKANRTTVIESYK